MKYKFHTILKEIKLKIFKLFPTSLYSRNLYSFYINPIFGYIRKIKKLKVNLITVGEYLPIAFYQHIIFV